MTRVPAVCDKCGAFFPSPIEAQNATHITFANVAVGPCPKCGGNGHVPDGTYNFIGTAIEFLGGPERSRRDLERLAAVLHDAKRRGASIEEIREAVKKETPELKSLTDLLPTTRTELYAFIAIIISILSLLLSQSRAETRTTIEVNQVINNVIEAQGGSTEAPSKWDPSDKYKNVGRNDPCPCGSGKKYKHCHLDRR
jgi:DNA-binding transcriptional MerR regulator